jgi:hypothetical protein
MRNGDSSWFCGVLELVVRTLGINQDPPVSFQEFDQRSAVHVVNIRTRCALSRANALCRGINHLIDHNPFLAKYAERVVGKAKSGSQSGARQGKLAYHPGETV